MTMKALILAAGFGLRLVPITEMIPKSLLPVHGTPILIKQIDNLHRNGVTDITVITGYKAEMIDEAVHSRWPEVQTIESLNYASTNNMVSAYIGRRAMGGEAFLMMNADVFFDPSVIEALLAFDAPDAIVTDIGTYNEESMKVVEKGGRLVAISKEIARERALGCSIDVYKFSPEGGAAFFDRCADYIERRGELKKWSEVALNDVLAEGRVPFKACPLKGRWMEIDNHEDLTQAEALCGRE